MGFLAKRLLRAFKLLTSTASLQETNRAYVCPQRIGAGTVFVGKPSCWTRCHFQKHKPHVCSIPTVCVQVFWGPVERAKRQQWQRPPRTLESPQSPPGSASLLQRSTQGPPLLLPTEDRGAFASASCPHPPPSRASIFVDFTRELSHLS